MTDFLITFHSEWRWLVLAALVVALGFGLYRWQRPVPFIGGSARVFSLAIVGLDIQVLLGVVVWITGRGWELGAFRAWIHPVGMLIALGVGHAFLGRARKAEGSAAYRLATLGILLTLVIVAASIPRDAWSF
jgi:hypothetical protein